MIARLFAQLSADARSREDLEWRYNDKRAWAALWKRAAKLNRRLRLANEKDAEYHSIRARDMTDAAAHWRGECRRLAELAVRHHKKRLLRDLEELEAEAERILKELDNR